MPRLSLFRVLGVSMLGIGLLFPACSDADDTQQATTTTTASIPEPTEFSGYVRTPALDVSSVTLPTVDGASVNMVADPDGILLVYFGYTSCPDVCPTTLSDVKKVLADQPDEDRARIQLDVITIDPGRDTPEKLSEYVERFVPDANAIRTDDFVLLRSAADAFGADFRSKFNERGQRQVFHTDDLYAVDDTGAIVLAWPFGTTHPDISRDLTRLLAGERPAEDPLDTPAETTPPEDR